MAPVTQLPDATDPAADRAGQTVTQGRQYFRVPVAFLKWLIVVLVALFGGAGGSAALSKVYPATVPATAGGLPPQPELGGPVDGPSLDSQPGPPPRCVPDTDSASRSALAVFLLLANACGMTDEQITTALESMRSPEPTRATENTP